MTALHKWTWQDLLSDYSQRVYKSERIRKMRIV